MLFICVYSWCKDIKATGEHCEPTPSTNCQVNVTHAKYFLLDFKDDSINFKKAVTADEH